MLLVAILLIAFVLLLGLLSQGEDPIARRPYANRADAASGERRAITDVTALPETRGTR